MAKISRPQFRVRTILAYTFVIAFGLAVLSRTERVSWENFLAISFVFLGPLLTLPSLLERAVDLKVPLRFGIFASVFQVLAVSFWSFISLLLSGIAFAPSWKGSKGPNWIFYLNDGPAAVIIFPFYLVGAVAFGYAILKSHNAVKSPFAMAAIGMNAAISLLYVGFVLVMRYITMDSSGQKLFVLVPVSASLSYSLMAIALWRRRELTSNRDSWGWMYGWCGGFLLAMLAKVPLAMRFYDSLPDEPPQGCFIVSAAARGHPAIVGSFYDGQLCATVNHQLIRFWQFEEQLAERSPRFHKFLRYIYNRCGPRLASLIVTHWQADLVYLLLKPLEWFAVAAVQWGGQGRGGDED